MKKSISCLKKSLKSKPKMFNRRVWLQKSMCRLRQKKVINSLSKYSAAYKSKRTISQQLKALSLG
jgi:hypothetical protein